MNTLIGAADPQPERTHGTAWWGWCHHCGAWFNNHQTHCPMLAPPVPSTTTNTIVWPITPIPNTTATSVTSWTMLNTAGR